MPKDDAIAKGLEYSRNPGLAMKDARKILDELEAFARQDPSMMEELNERCVEISCLGVCVAEIIKASLTKEISPEDGAVGMTNLYGALILLGYRDGLNKGRSESILKAIEEGGVGLSGNN